MKTLSLSKPMQAAGVAALVLVAVALMKPEAADIPSAQLLPALGPSQSRPEAATRQGAPWVRTAAQEWKPSEPEPARVPALAPVQQPVPLPVVEAPKPTAPDPAMTYLGSLQQNGRSYVFLATGADPQVVEIGGLVDAQWRVEKATATQLELRYLPLNESRFISVP